MRSIFCTSCGSKMVYSSEKPKFCSSCGSPMSQGIKPSSTPFTKKREKISEISEEETDASYVPEVGNFQCDFEVPQNNIYNLGNILNESQKDN